MKKLSILVLLISCQSAVSVTPLPNAHAHNDYHHERPLFEALENGFTSVEADVHLINGELYVTHDHPENIAEAKTLQDLYLNPLKKRVAENTGRVFKGYDKYFYLMIDVKTEALPTYLRLKEVLEAYESMLSQVINGVEQKDKPVKVFISGNRAISEILSAEPKVMALDGRPNDLGKGIESFDMPVVSQNYNKYLTWDGEVELDAIENDNLLSFVEAAQKEGKKVRLWGTPDRKEVWGYLYESGVDLINTDRLSDLRDFLKKK
ncbi:MAG: glycerophosphoryl diester phosphodiesterase [Cyclobacteriaceae bacterium]|jgi:glycerophosphoryl diester phosphodiesterase